MDLYRSPVNFSMRVGERVSERALFSVGVCVACHAGTDAQPGQRKGEYNKLIRIHTSDAIDNKYN